MRSTLTKTLLGGRYTSALVAGRLPRHCMIIISPESVNGVVFQSLTDEIQDSMVRFVI